jgi:radical SAM protein with 4Fe4S-binding SPASM domain
MSILNLKYYLPADIVRIKKGDKFLFLNPSTPAWIITNSNGAMALNLCNGKRTVNEISRKISKSVDRDTTVEIQNFFQKVIFESNLFSTRNKESVISKPCKLHTVHLNLTNKCNLKCIYCYADERDKKERNLGFKDYLNIIDSINNLSKNVDIVLTGGEPLLIKYALDVAEYAKNKGNQLHLLSNGLLINEDNVKKISELFDLVKISLDGSNSTIHDMHRGEGSFYKTLKAVDLLVKNKAKVQISMTVTKKNINDMSSMVNKFGSLLSFAPLFKAGRAKDHKRLSIAGKEYYDALTSIGNVNPLSYLCSSLDRAKKQRAMKCAIGDAEISISDTGDVYPCHLLHLPQFLAGNVKEKSLETIYQTSDNLKSCRQLTVLNVKGCKKCDIRFICGGACRARAFYEKNKINVSDKFCEYEKLAFINGLFELYGF